MTDPNKHVDRRQAAPRLRLAAEGLFIGLERRQTVTILDLSQTGAKVAFSEPPDDKAGFIRWMDFETFGDAMWRKGLYIGLQFDRPIPERWLIETKEHCEHIDEHEHEALMRAAQEWVEG